MSVWRTAQLLLPAPVRDLPADLAAAVVYTAVINVVVFAPVLRDTPLRVPLGLGFVLFLPGYALIAALFPEAGTSPTEAEAEGDSPTDREGIDAIERVALSFGLSIAIVPLIGLALNFTPWGLRLGAIMVATSGFVLAMVAIAAHRRRQVPAVERFAVPYRAWYARAHREVFEPDDRLDAALNVALAASILLAVGTLGFAVMFPPEGEQYSDLYILTEDDEADRVAAGYPTEFVAGQSQEIIVGVENNERSRESYTLVVHLQREELADNTSTVLEVGELDRFTFTLEDNETWTHRHQVTPGMVGEDLRLTYLLYIDDVPAEPRIENAYRDVYVWIDVESG